jgi:hypothetical protein
VKRAAQRIALVAFVAGCGGGAGVTGAPTYASLYRDFFAVDKPGHCASSACHGSPGNVWLCGADAHTCYQGMVTVGLVAPAHPQQSPIIDPMLSPLSWFNALGDMPFDSPGPFPVGRDAIAEWIAAGAHDD